MEGYAALNLLSSLLFSAPVKFCNSIVIAQTALGPATVLYADGSNDLSHDFIVTVYLTLCCSDSSVALEVRMA